MHTVLVLGYPSSGKSTLTKNYIAKGYVNLNRDTEGGKIVDLLPKLENLLKDNKNVVLDNLFATVDSRKPFIELAKKYGTVDCVVMGTSIEDSTFNAIQRMIDLHGSFPSLEEIKKSKHPNIFPVAVLFKYKKEYQKPTLDEGFSNIETVKFVRKDNPEFTNKALFLDFDGCLRECVGGNGMYPTDKSHVSILPGRTEVLKKYVAEGYKLIGVSNQSGVHKGELTYDTAHDLFVHTNNLLGVDIEVNFCPHQSAPPVCYCRKPQIGIFVNAMNKYKLDRKQCLFVGDMATDSTAAKRFGIQYHDAKDFFNDKIS